MALGHKVVPKMLPLLALLFAALAEEVSGTEPIDAAVADFAGAVIYMGELKDTMDVQIQADKVEKVDCHKVRCSSFVVGAASGVLLDLAAHEVVNREFIPKFSAMAMEQLERGRRSLARLRGNVAEVPEIEHTRTESRPAVVAAMAGLLLLGAMVLKARRKRGAVKAPPTPAETPVMRPKAKPPPPPRSMKGGPKASPRPKANTLDEGMLSPRSAEFARFGKRIHWVKPSCEEPQEDTIFGELKMGNSKSEDAKPKLQFDKDLMDAMFTPRSARTPTATPRRSWTGPKPQGICLLDNSRAHNIAIVLTKLAISTEELSRCIRSFDTGQQRLKADHVELLHVAMPTASEVTKLQENKHKAEALRDVERRMLPLCTLSPTRIKVMKFALTYEYTREVLMQRCKVLRDAADEARNSPQFRDLLAIILEAGNYINGDPGAQKASERVMAFSIESLQSLANFKVGCISCMHFLCITMRASDTRFLSCLEASLKDIRPAAKEKFSMLRSEVEAFMGEVNFAQARLREMSTVPAKPKPTPAPIEAKKRSDCSEPEPEGKPQGESAGEEAPAELPWPEVTEEVLARERLSMLVSDFTWKAHQLRLELARAEQAAVDVQSYFSTSGSPKDKDTSQAAKLQRVPPEQFFGHISGFLDMVKNGWNEIEANPGKWRQFMSSADRCKASGTSFARRIQDMKPGQEKTDSEGGTTPSRRGSTESLGDAPVSPRRSDKVAHKVSEGLLSPRQRGSTESLGDAPVSPRRSDKVAHKVSEGLLSPRQRGSTESLGDAPVSPRRSDKVAHKVSEGLLSPRKRGSTESLGDAPVSPRQKAVSGTPTSPRGSNDNQAIRSPRQSQVEGTSSEVLVSPRSSKMEVGPNHASKKAPVVPKLNLKMQGKTKQSPRARKSLETTQSTEDHSMRTFIASLDSSASAAFEVVKDSKEASGKGSSEPRRMSVPKLALESLQELVQPERGASSTSISYTKDKEGDESSTSSDAEDGQAGPVPEEGYCTCSSEGFGRESPLSAASPAFAPLPGPAKVPPIKMSSVFGPRGVTPSFGAAQKEVKPLGHQQSPRRLLSARGEENPGAARKILSPRAERQSMAQTCEFHQMNDSTDCEYHKLASSDSDSCATQSDEESEVRTSKRRVK